MIKKKKIYEGKAKILYETADVDTLIQHFKDDVTAHNNQKHQVFKGKGVLNNRISEFIFTKLTEHGIANHLIKTLNMKEQLITKLDIFPVEIVVRNIAAGSICKRTGAQEGDKLQRPIIEFYYKSDKLADPLITEEHIAAFGWMQQNEIEETVNMALRINDFLSGLFCVVGITLVDFKMEFGSFEQDGEQTIMLADEISPDTCRLWDKKTNKPLDKDVFRKDLGDLLTAYREVARRIGVLEPDSESSSNIYSFKND